jgi:anti-sigma B factor antagonist
VGGGDGTICEAARRLAHRDVALGLLPLGTTNNFARTLGIPLNLPAAIGVLAVGKVADVDLELLTGLVSQGSYQIVVHLDKVGFLDSTGLGVLVGGLKRVRAHDGSLDLVCTQQRILKILKITGLTEVFGIYQTVDQAIAGLKGRQ